MATQFSQLSVESLDGLAQDIPEVSDVLKIAPLSSVEPVSVESSDELKQLTDNAISDAELSQIFVPSNFIEGTPASDFLWGTEKKDFIFGLQSDDFILAQGGDDHVYSGAGNDLSFGQDGNDTFIQWSGNKFVDGSGNDTLVGGNGKDKVDYRFLGQPVTLEAGGKIDKGSAGTDQIFEVEEIVGAVGQKNAIDGTTGTGTASFNVNLFNQQLNIQGLPIGNLQFSIENFVNVTGTPNNDTITGDNNANTLKGQGGDDDIFGFSGNDDVRGGAGNDFLRGDAGNDTVRGGRGNDSLEGGFNDDLLIGAGGSNAGSGEIDVLTGGIPPFIFPPFEVDSKALLEEASESNFSDIESLEKAVGIETDSLTGSRQASSLSLSESAEKISIPILLDEDTFVLGNAKTPFYLGKSSFGLDDFAEITDFQSGADTIQLNGSASDYLFLGSSLIFQNNGSAGLDASDDLVGFVGGSGFNTNGSDFKFVG